MKKITTLIFVILLSHTGNRLNAQEDEQYQKKDSIITYSELSTDEARQAWNDMTDQWLSCCFYDCLKQSNIKLSCARCSKVLLTVDLQIDSSGLISQYRIIRENRCGSPFTEKLRQCFLEFFINAIFPENLRHIVFEINIGNGLKC
ncbi:MAG TPA: hypothetical protein PKW80_03775 [Bacteroidales bacterium]|nr:hypothetical protein [Bacteroidales bacterium]